MERALAALVLAGGSLNAETITFGSGANQFQIEFVEIGNENNSPDTSGQPSPAGGVPYTFSLGKHEISQGMILKANSLGGLGITLYDIANLNRPASQVSWFEAARFVNWLNISSGYSPAYKFNSTGEFQIWSPEDFGFQSSNPFRNNFARFALPSSNEWYKGAYGSPGGQWFKYTTGSDTAPSKVNGGTAPGTAVYDGSSFFPVDITNAGGLSAYGTMAQGGNVWEWIESAYDGINDSALENREVRGGGNDVYSFASSLGSGSRISSDPLFETINGGFRIAMIPEPSSLSLFLAGGAVLMAGRRRKQN